jgi:hypothetical protein
VLVSSVYELFRETIYYHSLLELLHVFKSWRLAENISLNSSLFHILSCCFIFKALLKSIHWGSRGYCHCFPPVHKVGLEGGIIKPKLFKLKWVVFGISLNNNVNANWPMIRALEGEDGGFNGKVKVQKGFRN